MSIYCVYTTYLKTYTQYIMIYSISQDKMVVQADIFDILGLFGPWVEFKIELCRLKQLTKGSSGLKRLERTNDSWFSREHRVLRDSYNPLSVWSTEESNHLSHHTVLPKRDFLIIRTGSKHLIDQIFEHFPWYCQRWAVSGKQD